MTLIKRADKGQALTYEEMDANFTHLGGDGSYQFPATDGLQNQVLTTDGNGNLTFQTISLDEITGDIKGSVFADDSSMMIDGTEGKIVGPVESATGSIEALKVGEISSTTSFPTTAIEFNSLVELKWTNENTALPSFTPNPYTTFYGGQALARHANVSSNFVVSYLNVPVSVSDMTFTVAHIIEQGATPYMITGFRINNISQTIIWQGGSAPTGTANGIDVISFTVWYDTFNDIWKIIGSATSYS
jgi:hypothetical protein